MSAHLELDFNDDGTITMTHRPAKGVDVIKSVICQEPLDNDHMAMIVVKAGSDESITHKVLIGTTEAINNGPLHGTKTVRDGVIRIMFNWWNWAS